MKQPIVLCVDDDATVLTSLETIFSKAMGSACVFEFAESGDEALEISSDLQKEGSELSVLISDFIMPGMRGDELLVRLHEKSPRTIKIMLTGQSDLQGVKRTINQANLYRFLEKPFNNADLVLTVRAAVQAYQQTREKAELAAEIAALKNNVEELKQLLSKYSGLPRNN
ncbi:MAG: response regulator [Rhodoferax sp.]|nr:response regulator [Rhodoferax sp.]